MAPELLSSTEGAGVLDGRKLDVYAFAVVLNALFACNHPFRGMDSMAVIAGVALRGLRPKIAAGLPPSCVALLKMCWHEQPELRPNFPEVAVALKELHVVVQNVNSDAQARSAV